MTVPAWRAPSCPVERNAQPTKPTTWLRPRVRAENNPIGAVACWTRGLGNQLSQIGFVQPHVIIDTRSAVANRKFPSRRRDQRPRPAELDDDLVQMARLEPGPNAALDRLPILHEFVWAETILPYHLAQGISEIVTQKHDAVRPGIGVRVNVSVSR